MAQTSPPQALLYNSCPALIIATREGARLRRTRPAPLLRGATY